MGTNYQIVLEKTIKEDLLLNYTKKLLLHACCAPCSSYCIEYLASIYDVIIYFYNPNITDEKEYKKRSDEISRFVSKFNEEHEGKKSDYFPQTNYKEVKLVFGEYDCREFFNIAKGLEKVKEGNERCYKCYELRLISTAKKAFELNADYFTTTLSISPYKKADWLNQIGCLQGEVYSVAYLFSDFKKNNGYKRSIELSQEYGLYRQDYCGCIYSKLEMEEIRKKKQHNISDK